MLRPFALAFLAVLASLAARSAAADAILYATAASKDRIDGFCIEKGGGLAPAPSVQVATGREPRRVLVVGNTLYLARKDGVDAFRIMRRGGLERIGGVADIENMNPIDLAVNPDRTRLYVTQPSRNRIAGYQVDADGAPEKDFSTCVLGPLDVGYQDLLVSRGLLYASSAIGRVDVFQLSPDGSLPTLAEVCKSAGSGTRPDDTATLSSRRHLNAPKAFVIKPDVPTSDGPRDVLYVEQRLTRLISAFRLAPDGNFLKSGEGGPKKQQKAASATAPGGQYEGLVLQKDTILGAAFGRGRIDAYRLRNNGRIRNHRTRSTKENLRMSPVRMTVYENVLYVSGGVFNRVVAYRLRAKNGLLKSRGPFSRTAELKDSFPNDVAVAVLPSSCR